jgi:hypothetical protein
MQKQFVVVLAATVRKIIAGLQQLDEFSIVGAVTLLFVLLAVDWPRPAADTTNVWILERWIWVSREMASRPASLHI